MNLDPLYEILPTLDPTDPDRQLMATASPLLLRMHLDPSIVPYKHLVFLDAHVTALCNLTLYPDGPGEKPEVWGRETEGEGSWQHLGLGFSVAVGQEAFLMEELRLVRPGSMVDPFDPDSAGPENHVTLKLAIALPPRHGKSLLVTETLPLWFLLRHPNNSVLVSTYSQDFADEWGQNLIDKLPEWSKRLPSASDGSALRPLNQTKKATSFRPGKDTGVITFKGAGMGITGTGWGLGIIDDPFKDDQDALSEASRKHKKNWYASSFSNRRTRRLGSPPPVEIMMFTRWHEDDLAGAFAYEEDGETAKDGWCVLRLPALAEKGDPLGRKPGASLCPQLAPLSFLEEEQEKDPTWFSCLFQGRPTHLEGSLFAKTFEHKDLTKSYHHFRETKGGFQYLNTVFYEEDLLFFVTVDTATSTKTSADWTVATLWGWHTEKATLLAIDRVRERVSSESHRSWLRSFLNRHTRRKILFVAIEDKTFGTTLINQLRSEDPDLVIVPVSVDKDKRTRAIPYAEAVRGGKALFPHPDECFWSVEWENEHAKFPNGKHDDQVDTGSMAWTLGQRYAYTAKEETKSEPTPHERAKAQLRRRRKGGTHDYHDLLRRI